ncbi:MAG: hypothetical protein WC141_07735 [Arcobacteraceae bacterium]
MSSLQKEPKIYGAVESESYITFTGFCKKIYNTTQQEVEVFIDGEKTETILANEKIQDIENKYEVFDTKGFCFTYKLPKELIGQKHKLEFKTKDGEQLVHSPTQSLDKFSPLYNQAMFIESLNQECAYNAIKDGYAKNHLSFIAIEENLEDEAFIEYVLEMCKTQKELTLTIIYFNETQKNLANKIFNKIKSKTFINPPTVEELIRNSEIYLHNEVQEFKSKLNEEYYNKVKNTKAIKENLFILELTRKAKKKKDMAEMVVDTVSPILFETSIVSETFKEDERYNEFVFMNSLGSVDKEKIKDMYCPNSIGFLATKENLEDEEFMGYIKELGIRFPNVQIKGFYFDDIEDKKFNNIEFFIIDDIKNIIQESEFFISNHISTGKRLEIYLKMVYSSEVIYTTAYDKNKKIENINAYNQQNHLIIKNYEFFGYSKEEVEKMNFNPLKLMIYSVCREQGNNDIDFSSLELFDFLHFTMIDIILRIPTLKKFFYERHKKMKFLSKVSQITNK